MEKEKFSSLQTIQCGAYKVTYIPDGGAYINAEGMYPTSDRSGWTNYSELMDNNSRVIVSMGGFLIESEDRKVLMDLGFGPYKVDFPGFGPFIGGEYIDNLEKVGLKPEDITDVFYTHLHVDHVGWTSVVKDGVRKLTFPQARYICSEKEWNYWKDNPSGLGPDPETVLEPLKDHISFISDGEEIAPGLTAHILPGHTPGFTALKLESKGNVVWFCADVYHSTVQFYEQKWYTVFDIDPEVGSDSREHIVPEFLKENVVLADGHFSNRVFGKLCRKEDKLVWEPID